MKKTTIAKIKISANWAIDAKIVEIRVRIEGREVKLLSGRNSLNVLIPDILFMLGKIESKLVMTTMKSSQFHASFRYALFPMMNPNEIILRVASKVNTVVKKGSVEYTILFLNLSLSGFS